MPPGATLPAQPSHLEHPLATAAQETRQTRTERACSFDSERTPTHSVRVDELQRLRVAVTVCSNRRLEDDSAAEDVHDRERVQVAVRVDTNDVVQLICEHP